MNHFFCPRDLVELLEVIPKRMKLCCIKKNNDFTKKNNDFTEKKKITIRQSGQTDFTKMVGLEQALHDKEKSESIGTTCLRCHHHHTFVLSFLCWFSRTSPYSKPKGSKGSWLRWKESTWVFITGISLKMEELALISIPPAKAELKTVTVLLFPLIFWVSSPSDHVLTPDLRNIFFKEVTFLDSWHRKFLPQVSTALVTSWFLML